MAMTMRVEGLRDLDAALADLSKGAGRGALRRAGVRGLQPMAELARSLAPVDEGELRDSISVSAKASGTKVGKAEFAAAMRAGLGREAAVAAMRDARRAAKAEGAPAFVELFMGPAQAKTKADAIKRIVMEFGSARHQPRSYMRPAWDQGRGPLLQRVQLTLAEEIRAAVARAERKAARMAAR
jgi:hypothetical protein